MTRMNKMIVSIFVLTVLSLIPFLLSFFVPFFSVFSIVPYIPFFPITLFEKEIGILCSLLVWGRSYGFPLGILHYGGSDSCNHIMSIDLISLGIDLLVIYWIVSFVSRKK